MSQQHGIISGLAPINNPVLREETERSEEVGIFGSCKVVTRHELTHRVGSITEVLLEDLRENHPEIGVCRQVTIVLGEQGPRLPG